jgi:hypothetical protein
MLLQFEEQIMATLRVSYYNYSITKKLKKVPLGHIDFYIGGFL